jgi:hypothetical protein
MPVKDYVVDAMDPVPAYGPTGQIPEQPSPNGGHVDATDEESHLADEGMQVVDGVAVQSREGSASTAASETSDPHSRRGSDQMEEPVDAIDATTTTTATGANPTNNEAGIVFENSPDVSLSCSFEARRAVRLRGTGLDC